MTFKRLLYVLLYTTILLGLLSSCNSVKRVMKDPEKFDIVAQEAVRRGYCVVDTLEPVITVNETSKDTVYLDTLFISLPTECNIDTTIDNVEVKIRDGIIYIKNKKSVKYKEKIIETIVEDVSRIERLKKDITIYNTKLDSARNSYIDLRSELTETEKDKNKISHSYSQFKMGVYGILGLVVMILITLGKFGILTKMFA